MQESMGQRTFAGDRVVLTYYKYPSLSAVRRFDIMPSYKDLQMTVLPINWFYRGVKPPMPSRSR